MNRPYASRSLSYYRREILALLAAHDAKP
jgi:hypothetical protein